MNKIVIGLLAGVLSINAYAGTRLLITFKPSESGANVSRIEQQKQRQTLMQKMNTQKVNQITKVSKHHFTDVGPLATGGRVIEFDEDLSQTEIKSIIDKLRHESDIMYVDEDIIFRPAMNQTNLYQWDMFKTTNSIPGVSSTYYGDHFFSSTDNNNPATANLGPVGQGVIVAVIDTGYTPHPNFLSNLVSGYGYTFISDCRRAGTCPTSTSNAAAVQSYTPDGIDLGDYLTFSQYNSAATTFKNECGTGSIGDSSWHGTHVTGTIIAQGSSNESSFESGILGGAYNAQVMPIRALGKCGGTLSDIINGMMWASGNGAVNIKDGQPIPQPAQKAQVLNMSLRGLSGTPGCPATYQDAINIIINSGTVIVAAAGNDSTNVIYAQPANCAGVISVAAVGPTNRLTSYSNYGPTVTISAAGGDVAFKDGGILSTMYRSTESYSDCAGESCFIYVGLNNPTAWQGTSMATPHVAAAVADILAMKHDATNSEVIQILENSADSFTSCLSSTRCVPNRRLNAQKAVEYANLIKLLTPDPMSLTFATSNLASQVVTLTNNNATAVVLESFVIAGNDTSNFVIESGSCIGGQTLSPTQSCTVGVKPVNITSSRDYSASLYAVNSLDFRVASINLTVTENGVTPTPTPAPIYTTSSGGCTVVEGGEDIGMIILLLGASVYYYRRKKAK